MVRYRRCCGVVMVMVVAGSWRFLHIIDDTI